MLQVVLYDSNTTSTLILSILLCVQYNSQSRMQTTIAGTLKRTPWLVSRRHIKANIEGG